MPFNKGLRQDELPINSLPGTWRDARNILVTKGFQAVSNDYGFAIDIDATNYGTYIGVIPFSDGYVAIYSRAGKTRFVKKVKGNPEVTILNTNQISTNASHPIEGAFKYNYRQELIIAFTDNFNRPYLFNVDRLPFAVDVNKELVTSSEIVRAYLFSEFGLVNYAIVEEREGGYGFPEGIIQLCIRYKIQDFDYTSCTNFSNPIPIKLTKLHTTPGSTPEATGLVPAPVDSWSPYLNYNIGAHAVYLGIEYKSLLSLNVGNQPDTDPVHWLALGAADNQTAALPYDGNWVYADTYEADTIKKSFNLAILAPDVRYESCQLIIVSKSHKGISAKIFSEYNLRDKSGNPVNPLIVTIDGFKGEDISIAEVITPRFSCTTVKSMTKVNDQLVMANIKTRDTFKWQKYANMIQVKHTWVNVPYKVSEKSDASGFDKWRYGDSVVCYKYRTFQPNEVYALYAHLVLLDGSITEGYHIPGRASIAGDKDNVTVDSDVSIRDNAKMFHLNDTSTPVNTTRLLGYWENENEKYPKTVDFNSTVDYQGNALGGSDLREQPVRHHRMPSNASIYSDATDSTDILMDRAIALDFSNVIIPNEIAPYVQGVIFSYAERTSGNRLVEGEGKIMHVDFWNPVSADLNEYGRNCYRFYDFNLMWNKPSINPNYLKLVTWRQQMHNKQDCECYIKYRPARNYKINSIKYVPPDNDILYNLGREEVIHIEVRDTDIGTILRGKFYNEGSQTAQLLNDLRDIYTDFYRQRVVITGEFFPVSGSGTYTFVIGDQTIGGDVFISRQLFQTVQFINNDNASTADDIRMRQWFVGCVYSPLNYNFIWYRDGEKEIPYYHTFNDLYEIKNVNNLINGSQYFRASKYNNIFSSINNLVDYGVINPYVIREDKDPHQVRRSIVFASEQQGIGWRIFPPEDYYEMPKHRGEIWKVYGRGKDLYILHEHCAYYAQIKDTLATKDGNAFLGEGDIFDRIPDEILDSERGTVGCRSQWGVSGSEFGVIVPDILSGKVFLLQGTKAIEISDRGMRNRWKEIEFLSSGADNPLQNSGIVSTYDDEYKRLIISVNHGHDNPLTKTLSYSFELGDDGGWICFHDYAPTMLFSNRFGVYSSAANQSIYKQNYRFTTRATYYDPNVTFPSYIDIPVNKDPTDTKRFGTLYWQSTVKNGDVTLFNLTCTHVMLYTDDQCSGLITIDRTGSGTWFKGNARFVKDAWFLNDFRDKVKDPNAIIIDIRGRLNNGNISNSKVWFDKSKFLSKFVIARMQFDNRTDELDWYLHTATVLGAKIDAISEQVS